jgi:hypothetical protein
MLIETLKGVKDFGRLRLSWKDNIKMVIKYVALG